MLFFKCCPRCKGDIYVNKDAYGLFMECLQCGFAKDLPGVAGRSAQEPAHESETVVPLPATAVDEQLDRAS